MDRLCIVMIRTYRPWYRLWLGETTEMNVLSPPPYFQDDTIHALAQRIRTTVDDSWNISIKKLSDIEAEYGIAKA